VKKVKLEVGSTSKFLGRWGTGKIFASEKISGQEMSLCNRNTLGFTSY